MVKKIIIITGMTVALVLAAIFVYRYQIMQYTAESLIRKYLPDYIKINTIKFDFRKGDILLNGFKVLNPPGFAKEHLIEIEKIACHYRMQGKTIIDGFELSSPVFSNAVLDIERLTNGRVNLSEAGALIEKRAASVSSKKEAAEDAGGGGGLAYASENRGLAGELKLPETFLIKSSKAVFTDGFSRTNPEIITLENIDAEVTLKLSADYKKILAVSSTGKGDVNGDKGQIVTWAVALDPNTPRLTMANRFEVNNVLITPFAPYYDRYSPLVFKAGRFSGLLVFDFDNGIIGSSDELALSGLKFFVKPGYENAQVWETTVPDLVKYFTSPYGEIIFDFKIKGDMNNPQFYLGPKSKAALVSMAVDKISAAIQKNAEQASGAPKSGIDKTKEYIDMFKGLMKR